MKARNAASSLGIDFAALQRLPSGRLLTQNQPVSPSMLDRLRRELDATSGSGPDNQAPLTLVSADETDPGLESARSGRSAPDQVAVFQLGRELIVPADRVIETLRGITGNRYGWRPTDYIGPELADQVRQMLHEGRTGTVNGRRAGTPRVAHAARNLSQLQSLRVQEVSPPKTNGERALARHLQTLDIGFALMGVDVPNGHNALDVDALVFTPRIVLPIEVKDTRMCGLVEPFRNGGWYVGGLPMQEENTSPAKQAVDQARALGSIRKSEPSLRGLPRFPGSVAVHGGVQFSERPVIHVGATDCFAFVVEDAVAAVTEVGTVYGRLVTAGHVVTLFERLEVSRNLRFTREELGLLGFPESAC